MILIKNFYKNKNKNFNQKASKVQTKKKYS